MGNCLISINEGGWKFIPTFCIISRDHRFSTGRELNRSLEIYYSHLEQIYRATVVDKTRKIIYQINK